MNSLSTSPLADLAAHPIASRTRLLSAFIPWASLLVVLLVAQGCCPGNAHVDSNGGSGFCDKPVSQICDCGKTDVCSGKTEETKPPKPPAGFGATRFGGPYPCQESHKKLNNFAIYQRLGLNKLVDVQPLTSELLTGSIRANLQKSPDRRYQRYNYVIDPKGTIRVAVWTEEKSSLTEKIKPAPIDKVRCVWPMIDFDGDDPFEIGGEKAADARWVLTPTGNGAKPVGLRDALSKHYRLAQPTKWRPQFVAERWNGTTVAYAGELIVDTRPDGVEPATASARAKSRESQQAIYYVNNGSGTYKPDAHFLRDVGRFIGEQLKVSPRYLASHDGDAWELDGTEQSLLNYGTSKSK
jgi:hypothetical protein